MFRSRPKPGLSRKIVAYYLLFCLIAVCWLAAGIVVTSHAVLSDQAIGSCLMRVGRASSAIEIHYLRHGTKGLNALLARLGGECRASYSQVVGTDGKILAHSSPALVGGRNEEPSGSQSRWGEVTGLEYANAAGQTVLEYRVPLAPGGKRLGELRLGVEQPSVWSTIQATARLAPWAVLAPLALIVAGAFVLSRLAKPAGDVDALLRHLARRTAGAELELTPLRARDALTVGWNRVVEHIASLERQAAQGDVTAVLARAAESRGDAQLEEVLQRLSDGVAVTDAEGRIAFANQAIAALLGDDAESADLTGAALEERLLESAVKPPGEEWLSAPARVRTAVCEIVQKSDDEERVLRVARFPLAGDESRGHVWSMRDVTQQKLTEQTRDRFIDTATHELRTPLSNIKAYAETLATTEHVNVELQKEFCNIINSEVTRLARFIDDLLSISSMEVGALAITRQKVETERMFAEILIKVEPLMQQKSIEFQTSLPPKMPELSLDKDKIVAVVVNLLGNAVKYTPTGGRVALKVKVEEGRLRVAIEDTGYGIAPEEVDKVFDKFFRSDDPRVQAETGTGLGLSLAREIVRMHHGEITVESELNQGSKFVMSLPLT